MSSCSIVIPVHDGAELTARCLDALVAENLEDAEIVVVDDGSTDHTRELLAGYGDAIRVIRHERPSGFAQACNAGAASARGRDLVLLNNDTEPTDGWLEALREYARAHPRVGIVGAKLLWPGGTVQHAGVVVIHESNVTHIYAGFPGDHPAVNESRAYQAVTGACMLVRREVFEQLGGLDTDFVNGYEDIDFCLRAGEQGYEVHYCHSCVVYHLESATRGYDHVLDRENSELFRRRWAHRLRPDDVLYYARDGLLEVGYDGPLARVTVSPLLGAHMSNGVGDLDEALAQRARQTTELLRENARLARAAPASVEFAGPSPNGGPASPKTPTPDVTVIVVLDHDGSIQPVVVALAQQTFPAARFEVLVMHPGTPIPAELESGELHLRQVDSGVYGGRAAAFNRGIREARADLVVLLAHDFVPCQGFLAAHMAAHESDPRPDVAAIGPGIFPPELRDSPFRRWLEDSGTLFGVPVTPSQPPPSDFFWCANTSLKRRHLLADDLFDEHLSLSAWDDYELGVRLCARGTEIRWVPEAMAIHEHPVTVAERRDTMQDAGISAARFDAKYPPSHSWHSGTDPTTPSLRTEAAAQWARLRHALSQRESDAHTYFEKTLRAAFLRGYRQELRRLDGGGH